LDHFGIGGPNRIYLTELIERKPCIFSFNASSVLGWSKTILLVRTQKRFLYRVAHTPVLSVRAEVPFGTDPTVPSESSLPSPEKRGSAFGDRCEPSFLFCQARRWCFTSPQAPCKNRQVGIDGAVRIGRHYDLAVDFFSSVTGDPQGGALDTDFRGNTPLLNPFSCGTKLFCQYLQVVFIGRFACERQGGRPRVCMGGCQDDTGGGYPGLYGLQTRYRWEG